MPTYCYACECGEKFVRVLPAISCRKRVRCPACSRTAGRDFIAEHSTAAHHPGNWPLVSLAAGVHPSQVDEARTRAKNAGVPTDFTPDGRVVFKSRQHRKEYCQLRGFHDNDGGFGDA